MGPIGCPKTSARNYNSTLREIPKERRSQICLYSPERPNSLWGPQRLKSRRYWGSCPNSEKVGRELRCVTVKLELRWSELSYGEVLVDKGGMYIRVTLFCKHLIILWLFHLGISCTVFVLICTVVVLYCFVMCVCVCVCVCVGFVMCGRFGNMYTVLWLRFFLPWMRFPHAFSSVVREMPG